MPEDSRQLPRLTERELADEAWWLWHRLYEFDLVGSGKRVKLNDDEVQRMVRIGRQIQEIRSWGVAAGA